MPDLNTDWQKWKKLIASSLLTENLKSFPFLSTFAVQVDLTDLCQMDNTVSGRLARPSASVDNILLDLHNYSFS